MSIFYELLNDILYFIGCFSELGEIWSDGPQGTETLANLQQWSQGQALDCQGQGLAH